MKNGLFIEDPLLCAGLPAQHNQLIKQFNFLFHIIVITWYHDGKMIYTE